MAGYPMGAAAPAAPPAGAPSRPRTFTPFAPATSSRKRRLVGSCAAGPAGAGRVLVHASRRAQVRAVFITMEPEQEGGQTLALSVSPTQAAAMAQGLRAAPSLALTTEQAHTVAGLLETALRVVAGAPGGLAGSAGACTVTDTDTSTDAPACVAAGAAGGEG